MECSNEYEERIRLCYDFGTWDYVVFGLLFLISACVGLFFAITSRNKDQGTDDYLLGGRSMTALPVSLSLTASFMSAVTVLGTPAEFYIYGTMFWYYAITYTVTAIVVSEIYIPLFYRLKITSTYEYLELRFNRAVRILATIVYIINTVVYVGIVIYAPALALNEVTGLGVWWSVGLTAVVCTFYTTLGGMKAVVWTDVFQCLVMWIGFFAVIIRGSIVMGGFDQVWQRASEGGRIQYDHFETDPKIRHTFWSIVVGGSFTWIGTYGTTQTMVQRYLSCRSENQAKIAIFINVVGLYIILLLTGFSGLVMYAYYAGCDPYSEGWVGATDQLMPYFVLELLHDYPGVPGIYVCSAFSGALSTVSSGINAMATVTIEDFIKPYHNLSSKKSVLISKLLVVAYGVICMGMAVLASQLGGVLQAALSINGMVGGPMVGLFTLAALIPWTNSIGAFFGLVCGLATSTWVYIGSTIYPPTEEQRQVLPLCTNMCNNSMDPSCGEYTPETSTDGTTTFYTTTPETTTPEPPSIADFYAMSYTYYGALGFVVTMVLGIITSFLTGYQHPSELPPGSVWPVFDHFLFRWIPENIRRKLWCGVDHGKDNSLNEGFHNGDKFISPREYGNTAMNEYYENLDVADTTRTENDKHGKEENKDEPEQQYPATKGYNEQNEYVNVAFAHELREDVVTTRL